MTNTDGRYVFTPIKSLRRKSSCPFLIPNAMRLPTPLSRRNPKAHKNQFGHVLVLAGSKGMLGAAALTGLAAMRAGAGLVTIGVPESLNATLQKKISPILMTLPLAETKDQTIDFTAHMQIKKNMDRFN